MTWSLADTEQVTNPLEREMFGITSNEQQQFKKEVSLHSIDIESYWETLSI
jgi:hypothetical protein